LISKIYRSIPVKRHFLGTADTAKDTLELVSSLLPNTIAIDDRLPEQSAASVINQAKQIHPSIRTSLCLTKPDNFNAYLGCPIVFAEQDILGNPDTLALVSMAIISNTIYRSLSINERFKQLK
jgi:DNA-binding NarL/FixJ family response regulator